MPNQRAKNKTYLGGFVEREFKDKISQLAREAGMEHDQFGFALQLIQRALHRRKATCALAPVISQPPGSPSVAAANGGIPGRNGQP